MLLLEAQFAIVWRVVVATTLASCRFITAAVYKLKELYVLYDGRTPESCIKENTQFKALAQTLLICAMIYILGVSLLVYLLSSDSLPTSKHNLPSHLRIFLYPILLPTLIFWPICKRIYKVAERSVVCFMCQQPFSLLYVQKSAVVDPRATSELMRSADLVPVKVERKPIFSPRKRYGLCLSCGTRFAIT
jgi:hypothetical protein